MYCHHHFIPIDIFKAMSKNNAAFFERLIVWGSVNAFTDSPGFVLSITCFLKAPSLQGYSDFIVNSSSSQIEKLRLAHRAICVPRSWRPGPAGASRGLLTWLVLSPGPLSLSL